METASTFVEKAKQCRRLSRSITDECAIEQLEALALEFDARAAAIFDQMGAVVIVNDN